MCGLNCTSYVIEDDGPVGGNKKMTKLEENGVLKNPICKDS